MDTEPQSPLTRANTNLGQAMEGEEGVGPHTQMWKQQRMEPVCTPILTSKVIKWILGVVGIIFVALGTILYVGSSGIVEQSERYDNINACYTEHDMTAASGDIPKLCNVTFTLDDDMELPVYFYYELRNFYQNHREFLASFSYGQLTEGDLTDTSDCYPLENYNNSAIYPCGLVANSFFSDRFNMFVNDEDLCQGNCVIPEDSSDWKNVWKYWHNDADGYWKKEGIAWSVDTDERFDWDENWEENDGVTNMGEYQAQQDLYLPDLDDEDYMVWARTAALPTFRKLHRIIDDLPSGESKLKKGDVITVTIVNYFSVEDFDGEKHFVLTTISWFGGSVLGLAYTYFVMGGLSVLFGLGIYIREPARKLGPSTQFVHDHLD